MALQPRVSFSSGAEAVSAARGDAVIKNATAKTIDTIDCDSRIKLNRTPLRMIGIDTLNPF
jgi:hypothetical protein